MAGLQYEGVKLKKSEIQQNEEKMYFDGSLQSALSCAWDTIDYLFSLGQCCYSSTVPHVMSYLMCHVHVCVCVCVCLCVRQEVRKPVHIFVHVHFICFAAFIFCFEYYFCPAKVFCKNALHFFLETKFQKQILLGVYFIKLISISSKS